MPSHFSSLGFTINSQEDFVSLAEQLIKKAEAITVSEGKYLRWVDESGAEIWLQADVDGQLIGMNPHFSGKSEMRTGITSEVRRHGNTSLDGSLHAWANPDSDDPEMGDYPFVFDIPNFKAAGIKIPSVINVQMAAFAHEITLHESEDHYNDGKDGELHFASKSFIPSGLFSPSQGSTDPPQANAIFTGYVLESESRVNTMTGNSFVWALVDTLGGQFDVVIDPVLIEKQPKIGGILSGSFWLSGKLKILN